MANYIFVDETINSFANKKQLRVHYRQAFGQDEQPKKTNQNYIYNPSSVSLTINQRYAEAGKIFPLATREGDEVFELDEGAPYLEVLISRATSHCPN